MNVDGVIQIQIEFMRMSGRIGLIFDDVQQQKIARLAKFRIHSLRNRFAIKQISEGKSEQWICSQLGSR